MLASSEDRDGLVAGMRARAGMHGEGLDGDPGGEGI